jgi:hypothetical protein
VLVVASRWRRKFDRDKMPLRTLNSGLKIIILSVVGRIPTHVSTSLVSPLIQANASRRHRNDSCLVSNRVKMAIVAS